ncbi:MAG: biotin--[acetyl-CoA-carboxylase] ligase [Candidatus Omnitrophica bacterium]|nr:biotin--[acetyl-CoA-carboxylase] ligase [Candidatus Omnitrophota bacterium]
MNEETNAFSASDIESIKSESFVRTVESYRELASTNDLALQRATIEALDTPLLVIAERQTAGRGRGGNQWWSAPGALTFSLLIDRETLDLREASDPRLSLTTGLAVSDALGDILPIGDFQLKWPNDIYLESRKVAGILLERSSTTPNRLVVGIGVNVNNSLSAAPEDIRTSATSLHDTSGGDYRLSILLLTILNRLEVRYRMLADNDPRLAVEWEDRCYLRNRFVRVESGDGVVEGVCRGIDKEGALLIDTHSGLHRLVNGVVLGIE